MSIFEEKINLPINPRNTCVWSMIYDLDNNPYYFMVNFRQFGLDLYHTHDTSKVDVYV